ncbi:MAG: hypothetical protein ACRCTO_21530 [Pseudomonas paracarnis]
MSGQAETAPGSLDDLASFLEDKPLQESEEQEDDAPPQEDSQEQPEEDESAVDESEAEASEEEAEDQPSVVFKVTVKGEDGADQTLEVDQKELIAGYQRQRDYTVKTQALAERERQAFEVVTSEIEKSRSHFMQQAAMAYAAVNELAGLRSPEEMAQLAHTDPSAWVQEQQRSAAVQARMQQIQQGMQAEQAQAQQMQAQQRQQLFQKAWSVLQEKGIDKPKLAGIYQEAAKRYGFGEQEFASVYDPRLVLALRDAVAYRALHDKKPAVQQKAQTAPKLPATKQPVARSETKIKQLETRFTRKGGAKLDDLAAYLSATGR